MNWSWKIATIRGIGVYVHWTFLIIVAWTLFVHYGQGEDTATALKGVGFVLAVFGCVLLHELGHALAAQQFGIPTKDITLLPIGGLARLERIPEEPLQELWVAIAGPLVNVVIAGILFLVTGGLAGLEHVASQEQFVRGPFLQELMLINIFLVVFNLLPAFPMDGGRVLRALLAMKMDYVRATKVAASVGQFMAILFGFVGLFNNIFLLFIALFVYLGAQEEANAVQVRSLFRGIPVRDAMITHFRALTPRDPLSLATKELLAGTQQDFPVVDGDKVVGLLTRAELMKAISEGGTDLPVDQVMRRDCPSVTETAMLDQVFPRMREGNCSSVPVLRNGRLVGMLNLENVGEFLMIQSALRQFRRRADAGDFFRPA